jgi:hypothetical protein
MQSPRLEPKSQPLMQNGYSCAAAGKTPEVKAAQHTVTAQKALRIASSVPAPTGRFRPKADTAHLAAAQFTFPRCVRQAHGAILPPRDQ